MAVEKEPKPTDKRDALLPKRLTEREQELEAILAGRHGDAFEAQAKLRMVQFLPERGVSMFDVPEIESRKRNIEDAIDRGTPGPNGEQDNVLAFAHVGVNIEYYVARLSDVTSEEAIRSCRDNIKKFVDMSANLSLMREYFEGCASSIGLEAAKARVDGKIEVADGLITVSNNWLALGETLVDSDNNQ